MASKAEREASDADVTAVLVVTRFDSHLLAGAASTASKDAYFRVEADEAFAEEARPF